MNEAGRTNHRQRQTPPQSHAYVPGAELQVDTPGRTSAHDWSPSERGPSGNDSPVATDDAGNQSMEQEIRDFNSKSHRYLKPRAMAQQLSPRTADLAKAHKKSPARRFPGLFASAAEANEALESLQSLYRKPLKECTTPIEDETFPGTDGETVAVVKQVFEAIVDWSYILEWKSALSREAKAQVAAMSAKDGGKDSGNDSGKEATPSLDGFRPSPEELKELLPSIDVQQKLILGQIPSDQTVEWVSWGIVVRLSNM